VLGQRRRNFISKTLRLCLTRAGARVLFAKFSRNGIRIVVRKSLRRCRADWRISLTRHLANNRARRRPVTVRAGMGGAMKVGCSAILSFPPVTLWHIPNRH
jgi:hypothetical protein